MMRAPWTKTRRRSRLPRPGCPAGQDLLEAAFPRPGPQVRAMRIAALATARLSALARSHLLVSTSKPVPGCGKHSARKTKKPSGRRAAKHRPITDWTKTAAIEQSGSDRWELLLSYRTTLVPAQWTVFFSARTSTSCRTETSAGSRPGGAGQIAIRISSITGKPTGLAIRRTWRLRPSWMPISNRPDLFAGERTGPGPEPSCRRPEGLPSAGA